MHMKSNLKLTFSLVAIILGFGSQWNCTIQVGQQNPPTPQVDPPPATYGCMNQQPTYTLGERPSLDEYTIIVQKFKLHEASAAHGLAADLRAKRVHNSVWPDGDKTLAVSVGRYWTKKQAEDKLRGLHERGYTDAYVAKPKAPQVDGPPPPPPPDWPALFALIMIVVLVILGVASQTKK